jgi:hypothetical protein
MFTSRSVAAAALGMTLGFAPPPNATAQTWVQTSAHTINWQSIASSSDGQRIVAAGTVPDPGGFGAIYTSADGGTNWTQTTAPAENWRAVASSADGSRLAAASMVGHIYTSTNSGTNWAVTSAPAGMEWAGLASSAEGTRLVAAVFSFGATAGTIYTSTNAGATWTDARLFDYFRSFGVSADGNKIVAAAYYETRFGRMGGIYISDDAGNGWHKTGPNDAFCAASSADGKKLVVGRFGLEIQASRDAGVTWGVTTAPQRNWSALACSQDRTRIAAVGGGYYFSDTATGPIYTSVDSGVTWVSNAAPAAVWQSVASSADGCRLFAAVNGGGIYTYQLTPAPVLAITPANGGFIVSWVVPSMNFVLQERDDLVSGNWADVDTTPTPNYTNLNYDVAVPTPSGSRFYRLVSC